MQKEQVMRVPLLGLGVLAAGVLLCVASLVASDRALKSVGTSSAAAANDDTMAGMDMSADSTSTVKVGNPTGTMSH